VTPRDVGALRAEFDAAFAAAPPPLAEPPLRLLRVRIGDERYAVRAEQTRGLLDGAAIAQLPGAAPHVFGLLAVRSAVVAVLDASALLGGAPTPRDARWVLRTREPGIGLVVGGYDGSFDARPADLHPGSSGRDLAPALAHGPDGLLPVLDLGAVLALAHARARPMEARRT
jgi:chemotaxis signal transduction protein